MAQYTDGRQVVHGPFGGDDLYPFEIRMIERARERKRNVWWRKLLRKIKLLND